MRLLFLLGTLFFSLSCFAESIIMDEVDFTVRQIMTEYMKKSHIEGAAVELYLNGKPRSYYFGFANYAKKQKVTKNTIFEVGSITKVFTSILLAKQIEHGKMNLEDPLSKYVNVLNTENFSKITLLNLATHTSGLPFTLPDSIQTPNDVKNFLLQWTPSKRIGSQWGYSNVGIGLLGHALRSEMQTNYDELYREEILKPLAMQSIGTSIPNELESFAAQGYDRDGNPVLHKTTFGGMEAAGALKASGKDLLRFLSASLALRKIPEDLQKAIVLTQTPFAKTEEFNQGLGWEIHDLTEDNILRLLNPTVFTDFGPIPAKQLTPAERFFSPNKLIDKTGTTAGFRAYIALIPAKKTGIVILTNHYSSNGEIKKVGRKILFKLNHLQ